jgi:hypothetical protein
MSDPSFDPYAPPKADVNLEPAPTEAKRPAAYFLFSPAWTVFLATVTVGFFQIYWGYRQWDAVKSTGRKVSSVGRAIFLIFSVHALFRHIQGSRIDAGLSGGRTQGGLATVFVLLTIGVNIAARSDAVIALIFFFALSFGCGLVLVAAQKDINELAEKTGTFINRGLGVGGIVMVILGSLAFVASFIHLAL